MNKIKGVIKYFIRDNLDIKQHLLNVTLILAAVSILPASIATLILSHDFVSLIPLITIFIVVLFCLFLTNVISSNQGVYVFLCSVVQIVILPVTYFVSGGRNSGMPLWLLLGGVFIWLVLDGTAFFLLLSIDLSVVALMMWLEANEIIIPSITLSSSALSGDIFQSIFLVCFVLGGLIKYQRRVFEKEHKRLEKRELELEKALEEVEKANKAKSEFIINFSHEIKTPLNAMMGLNDIIIGKSQEKSIKKIAENINSAGATVLEILNDMQDISQIESGLLEIVPREYDLPSLMLDCHNMVYSATQKKHLNFRIENNNNLPQVLFGDVVRIRQVLMNLMMNAIQNTELGSIFVKFDYTVRGQNSIFLNISVKDTGVGMSEEKLRLILGNGDSTTDSKDSSGDGHGLGMAITRQLIRLMSGTIGAESREGYGTEFIISIPQGVVDSTPMGEFNNLSGSN